MFWTTVVWIAWACQVKHDSQHSSEIGFSLKPLWWKCQSIIDELARWSGQLLHGGHWLGWALLSMNCCPKLYEPVQSIRSIEKCAAAYLHQQCDCLVLALVGDWVRP
jgi:hypothetical protein